MNSNIREIKIKPAAGTTDDTKRNLSRRNVLLAGTTFAAASAMTSSLVTDTAQAQQPVPANGQRPNIVVIWGDDIGFWNVGAYSRGMMGYQTPNIDRIGNEGALFTDMYAQQSCTAGRAAFILGQSPFRTGLLTIGVPGSSQGITKDQPTIAELLKPLGYTSGQFGKNHLGDRDEHLPTNHGFDEFFGNLYHLNAEEEPEGYYYPKNPEFRKKYGPRGVIHSWANPDGTQKIEDTGPLTTERMPTVDQEIYDAAMKFVDGAAEKKKPFFLWFNTTRMHVWTRLKKELKERPGLASIPTAWSSTTPWSAKCSRNSMTSASPTTPLSFTQRTMAQRN